MSEEDYKLFKEAIIENIRTNLSELPDNPLFEQYQAKKVESYLRSLEILERIQKNKMED